VSPFSLHAEFNEFWKSVKERYHFLSHDTEHPLLPPEELYLKEDAFFSLLKPFAKVALEQKKIVISDSVFLTPPNVSVVRKEKDPVALLRNFLETAKEKVLICADSAGRRESIKQLLEDAEFLGNHAKIHFSYPQSIQEFLNGDAQLGMVVASLNDGFYLANLSSRGQQG
jgi:transcription-repair coupling factor (superfamily II helicase)